MNNVMNKTDLINYIADKSNLSYKNAANALDAFQEAVITTLQKQGSVSIVGFGSFSVTERPERTGRNPRTGETIVIAASNYPKFRAGKDLRDALKQDE